MTDIELRIRIAQSLAEVPAAAWDACASADDIKPVHEDDLSSREDNFSAKLSTRGKVDNPVISRNVVFGRRAHWLAAAPLAGGDRRWHAVGRRTLLREKPFAGRICLRPWLGRGLRARRRRVLPQA